MSWFTSGPKNDFLWQSARYARDFKTDVDKFKALKVPPAGISSQNTLWQTWAETFIAIRKVIDDEQVKLAFSGVIGVTRITRDAANTSMENCLRLGARNLAEDFRKLVASSNIAITAAETARNHYERFDALLGQAIDSIHAKDQALAVRLLYDAYTALSSIAAQVKLLQTHLPSELFKTHLEKDFRTKSDERVFLAA